MSVETTELQITTTGGESMGAYLAKPEGDGPFPAVLVFMEIFGVNDHIRDVTRRVAAEGYVALAPDYFHRTGPGMQLAYDEAGMAEGMAHLQKLSADQMISDAQDAITALKARSDVRGDRLGAMGFCIGGHMTFLVAATCEITAAASYYGGAIAAAEGLGGGPSTLSRASGIRGQIQCFFGEQDGMIPEDQVAAIRAELAGAGIDHGVTVYPGADHGFNCDQRGSYNADAAADAWSKTFAMFGEKLRD